MDLTIQTLIVAIVGGILPSFVWLVFWLQEDKRRPEPRGHILRVFVAGALAVFLALYLENLSLKYFLEIPDLVFNLNFSLATILFIISNMVAITTWALIEELLKFLAVGATIFPDKHFDEPMDPMIYMITGALGFAAMENILFLVSTVLDSGLGIEFILTGNLRFLGATMLHVVSSVIIGASLSLTFCENSFKKITYFIGSFVVAVLLHALFNFFILINEGVHTISVLIILWLVALFVIFFFEKVKRIVCHPDFLKDKNN